MGIIRTIQKLNVEAWLVMLFIGLSVVLHSLWPGCVITLALVVKHALQDFYNYKQTDSKIIQSDELQAELDVIRQSHTALTNSTETVNTQLKSLQTALSMVGTNRAR